MTRAAFYAAIAAVIVFLIASPFDEMALATWLSR